MKLFLRLSSLLVLASSLLSAQTAVTTYQYDTYRSGSNPHESTLTLTNVNVNQFGLQRIFHVQGYVYAQPLYVPNVVVNGVSHNILYVVTEHDQVYAFDVNSGAQIWQKNLLITTGPLIQVTSVSSNDVNCDDMVPEIGITGTPVIDTTLNTMYVIAKTKVHNLSTGQTYFQQTLYAIDIRTGMFRTPPHGISAQVPGTGQGSHGGFLNFDPLLEGQRAGLLLSGNNVYAAWASHCDNGAYHGWLMAFNKVTLYSQGAYVDTPNGREGGYWAGGSGPAADSSGSLYVVTGNGDFNVANNDYGDSVQRITWANRAFTMADYFTPWDQQDLDNADKDQGSGGVLLLPDQPGAQHPHLLIQVGKEGTIDLVDRDNMGHFNSNNDSQIVQTLPFVIGGMFGGPAFWNNTAYFGGIYDHLKAFGYNPTTQQLTTSPTSQSSQSFHFPGPSPVISSNGTSNAILWAIQADAYGSGGAAVLHAYSATNLATELYNTTQNATRDNPGAAIKFTVPTVADGHVFVPTQNQVAMYGLLN